MTHNWIVGVDGSENARHALHWTVQQAIGRDVVVTALATWMPFVDPGAIAGTALTNPADLGADLPA